MVGSRKVYWSGAQPVRLPFYPQWGLPATAAEGSPTRRTGGSCHSSSPSARCGGAAHADRRCKLKYTLDPVWHHRGGGTLFVGGQKAATDRELLQLMRIRFVVNCTDELATASSDPGKALRFAVDKHRKITSEQGVVEFFNGAIRFISQHLSGGCSVLAFCHAGTNQAAAVAAGFLIMTEKMAARDAVGLVMDRRKGACCGKLATLLERLARCLASTPPVQADTPVADRRHGSSIIRRLKREAGCCSEGSIDTADYSDA